MHVYNARVHTCIAVDPLSCSDISRVAFIGVSRQKHAVTFQEQWNFEEQQDFEEVRYFDVVTNENCIIIWLHLHMIIMDAQCSYKLLINVCKLP